MTDPEKKVVLFGKTGSGKSTIANVLVTGGLQPVEFPYSDGTEACTREPRERSGRGWTVLDTVGLGAIASKSAETKPENQLRDYLCGLKGEYSHIIYVIKGDRVSEIDLTVWFLFTEIFKGGEAAFVILFTGVEEEWIETQRPHIPVEMKAVKNICAASIPPVDRNYLLETLLADLRREQIENLSKRLEHFFAERNYEYVRPDISSMDPEALTNRSMSIIRRVLEMLKGLLKRENLREILKVVSSVMDIAAAVLNFVNS